MATTYLLTTEPYLDTFSENYRNILSINLYPIGPLGKYIVRMKMPILSPFQCDRRNQCVLALNSLCGNSELMCDNELGDLVSFLLSNGYTVDTSLTNMMNKSPVKMNNKTILFFITYKGK